MVCERRHEVRGSPHALSSSASLSRRLCLSSSRGVAPPPPPPPLPPSHKHTHTHTQTHRAACVTVHTHQKKTIFAKSACSLILLLPTAATAPGGSGMRERLVCCLCCRVYPCRRPCKRARCAEREEVRVLHGAHGGSGAAGKEGEAPTSGRSCSHVAVVSAAPVSGPHTSQQERAGARGSPLPPFLRVRNGAGAALRAWWLVATVPSRVRAQHHCCALRTASWGQGRAALSTPVLALHFTDVKQDG